MNKNVCSRLLSVVAIFFVLTISGCHYWKTAYYTGGPDYPRDIIQHSETWTIVALHPDFEPGHVEEGDIIRMEHSGDRKRPRMIWRGMHVDGNGDGTADGDEEVEVEMRELRVGDYDFETVEPVYIGDHPHLVRVRQNYEGSDVEGEILFWFEDCGVDDDGNVDCTGAFGEDHGGHAGGGR